MKHLIGRWVVILSVLVFLMGAGIYAGSILIVGRPRNPTTVQEVRQQLSSAVPIGSSRAEVEAWLRGKSIEHSYQPADSRSPDGVNGIVHALIRDTDRDLFVQGSIAVRFLFDKDAKCAQQEVEWVGTGP